MHFRFWFWVPPFLIAFSCCIACTPVPCVSLRRLCVPECSFFLFLCVLWFLLVSFLSGGSAPACVVCRLSPSVALLVVRVCWCEFVALLCVCLAPSLSACRHPLSRPFFYDGSHHLVSARAACGCLFCHLLLLSSALSPSPLFLSVSPFGVLFGFQCCCLNLYPTQVLC